MATGTTASAMASPQSGSRDPIPDAEVTTLSGFFIALGVLVALGDWRVGIAWALAIGALQDPVRKLTPDHPPIMALCAIPIWLAVWASALSKNPRLLRHMSARYPSLSRSVRFFLVSLVPPTVLAFGYGPESWRLAVLGGFGYLAPLVTALVGYVFVRRPADLRRLLGFYAVFTAVMMVGTLMEQFAIPQGWAALGTEAMAGAATYKYYPGHALKLMAGFYRSPDIMAWHAASLTMIALTLALACALARRHGFSVMWVALASLGFLCVFLGGRRKAVVMPLVWFVTMLVLYMREKGRRQHAFALVLLAVVVAGGLTYATGETGIHEDYFAYAATTAGDGSERFASGTVDGVLETIRQTGILGAGIGSATQGKQYVGIQLGTWQESGASKLAVELGVPGLLCSLLLGLVLVRVLLDTTHRLPSFGATSTLAFGLCGVLAADAASFAISHQIYGDPTILLLTSLFPGLILSGRRWASRVAAARIQTHPLPLAEVDRTSAAAPQAVFRPLPEAR
jgi:hypothetical protein